MIYCYILYCMFVCVEGVENQSHKTVTVCSEHSSCEHDDDPSGVTRAIFMT